MPRGKAQRKSSMRGKRGLNNSRSVDAREMGKKVAGESGRRTATSGSRGARIEEGSERTRRMAAKGGRAGKGSRRARKSDI